MEDPKRARSWKRRKQPRDDLQLEPTPDESGIREGDNDDAEMGSQESDGPVVPEDRRKPVPTANTRGGKGTTVSKVMMQLDLFRETADSPTGGASNREAGLPSSRRIALLTSRTTKRTASSAMGMEEIADEKNLRIAFMEVASNKGAPGPDRQSIDEVRERIDSLLPALASALLDGSYRPGTIRRVWIPKAGGGRRGLGIPNVIDRLVQQAVHRVLSPHLEATFHESSHGFRPGRGCHTAIAAAKEHLEAGHQWLVDIDLKSFFDRVHHQRLLARLEQLGVKDPRVLRLIHRMLKAKVVLPNGVLVATKEGTPQGGPLSPLLSNVVLDELDLELERRGLRFVRYADDCNVYVRSERAGLRVMASLTRFIERHLRLEVNHGKSAVARPATRHFVGFCLQRSRDGVGVVRLSARSRNRINRRVVELTRRNWGNSLDAAIERINQYLKGWIGFFHIVSKAEVYNLGVIDAHIRRRLRALVLRQKKRRTHIVRWLHRERRVALKQARIDVYGNHRSLWALSITKSAHKAMSSHWFDRLGLLRLKRLWRQRNADPIAPAQLVLELG